MKFMELSFNCGVNLAYNLYNSVHENSPKGRTFLIVCGFVNTRLYKKTYKKMCESYKLLYQSPIRDSYFKNQKYFFCVFDRKID